MIEMHDVTSTQLAKIGWSKDKGLVVIFTGGNAEYRYAAAPADLLEELLTAESCGQVFNSKIKGRFAHTKHDIEGLATFDERA